MPQTAPFSWKDARLLIADDEPDMREIFAAWFRNLGCSVTEVADGKEALDALTRERFDAIVTDVRMPRVDGLQLVHQLHQAQRYIPVVIFVSGNVDLTLPDAFDLGIEAVLAKPCDKKELIGAVHRSLLRRQLIFEPPVALDPPAPDAYIRESFAQAPDASQVALGRGGMSLNFVRTAIENSAIGFELSFAEGTISALSGWGQLRWCDATPRGTRIGIEFLHLDEQSLRQFSKWLAENNPVGFIPKDCHSRSVAAPSR
jgi:CheY-like chemotaxis protein